MENKESASLSCSLFANAQVAHAIDNDTSMFFDHFVIV